MFLGQKRKRKEKKEKEIGKEEEKKEGKIVIHVNYMLFTTSYMEII